jgi:hypothetical protein
MLIQRINGEANPTPPPPPPLSEWRFHLRATTPLDVAAALAMPPVLKRTKA